MTGFNWIEDLSPSASEALREKSRIRSLPGGITLYRQRDPMTEVFQIVSGAVRQCILTADGQEVLIYIYRPGDVIGDSAVASNESYSINFITRGKSVLRVWGARDFNDLRARYHDIEAAIVAQTNRRLKGALQIIEELLTLPVAAGIASRFVSLAQMQKSEKVAVSLSLSQSDIGLMVGSARPNVNRAIRELRELGLIETDYGRILVKNREGLVRYINDHGRQTKNNIDDE